MDMLRLLTRSSGIKLDKSTSNREAQQSIPSASGSNSNSIPNDNSDNTSSKKRKRSDFEEEDRVFQDLAETDIRKLQKEHKIKITDLRILQDERTVESRKVRKEASRIYPQPLQSFQQLKARGVNASLVANIAAQAYREPTEVQLATIPLLLNDTGDREPDLLTVAPTGSGKTLAFLIPLIDKISKIHGHSEDETRYVRAIILAPTKELVSQIVNEGRKLVAKTGVRISEMSKGLRLHEEVEIETEDISDDEDEDSDVSSHSDEGSEIGSKAESRVQRKAGTVVKSDVLVSTPLLLLKTITPGRALKPLPLTQIHNLLFDEADVLLDPLFREQTLSIWSACTSPELRVSLWSATIGSSIEELAVSTIQARHHTNNKKPDATDRKSKTASSSRKTTPLLRTIIGLKDTSLPSISHRLVYASNEQGKLMGLRELLHPSPSHNSSIPKQAQSNSSSTPSDEKATQPLRPPFLIFTQTIPRAQSLYSELQYDIPPTAGGSTRIALLHSNMSSTHRSQTMTQFRQGKIWILITTDLLSRGVDFLGVNGVVNYDIPTTPASYVHRAGRTGRAGRKGGIVVTFYTKDDVKYLKGIANIIQSSSANLSSSSPSSHQPHNNNTKEVENEILPKWLIPSLPKITQTTRTDLKKRGTPSRRAPKESDTAHERRVKLLNRIGTKSVYQRGKDRKLRDMKEGSARRMRRQRKLGGIEHRKGEGDAEFGGFDD